MTRLKYITSEILYTIFIILVTTSIVYLMLLPKIKQNLSTTALLQQETSQEIATQSADISNADSYIEQGSPYDKRTIGTDSANVIFHGDRSKKQIAITFDAEMTDGMKAAYISGRVKSLYEKRIIDILNDTHTKATLFLTGMWIELYPVITKELSQNSLFELGSHSYTDSSYHGFCYGLSELPNTLKIEDIGATEKLLREYAGIDNRLFRFPGGCYTPSDVKLVNDANDTVVHWDVVAADGFNNNT